MPSNPFSALERQNFPEFSPVFTKTRTPSSAERNGSFHWSIDHIARLKPADIDTDPATLVKTNGHSPEDDKEAQEAVDTFFSQCTILPSPWTTGRKTTAKRVTFSPLPPTMAFIREESFVESEQKASNTADSGTQTVLTFPISCDLEKLLAGATSCFSEDDNNRDLSSSSLRRKLFGKPDRQGWNIDSEEVMEVEGSSPRPPPIPDATATPRTPLFKKGCGPPSTPLHHSHLDSPAIILGFPTSGHRRSMEDGNNPAMSSMILEDPNKDLPEFSPIRGSEGQDPSNVGPGDNGKVGSKSLIPTTPCKTAETKTRDEDGDIPVSPIVSPIRGHGAILSPTHPNPVVVHMGGIRPMSSGKTTSTPNTAVMKRQLAASPFASPVLKQPCTARLDMEDCNSDSSETEDLAQPLSLGDLRTETYDLTSITATTCSSYFTQIGLECGESRHPLHSTATTSYWHPPVHSTMVESQRALASNNATNLPTIREISQIPSSTSAADSGVAALAETNTTSTVNLSSGNSSKFDSNELSITKSSSNPVLLQANKDEVRVPSRPDVDVSQTQNGAQSHKAREKWLNSRMLSTAHPKIRHPDLPTIQENEAQMETPTEKTATAINIPCEPDSGLVLVPSPDTYSRPTTDQHKLNTHLPTSMHAPARGILISLSPHLVGSKLQGPALLHTAKYNSTGANAYGGTTHSHSSPSLQCTPSRYNTLGSEGLVQQIKFTTKSVFPSSVLPSRLKFSSTSLSSQFPSVYPQLGTTSNSYHQYESTISTFGGGGGSHLHSTHTPPSRYSSFRGGPSSLGSKASFTGFTREVLRRKESLKSRLQFSSPIKSTSPFSSPVSNHLNLPIYGAVATGSCVPVTKRVPLTEVGFNRPKSPMNCCCGQFGSSSPLSHGNQCCLVDHSVMTYT